MRPGRAGSARGVHDRAAPWRMRGRRSSRSGFSRRFRSPPASRTSTPCARGDTLYAVAWEYDLDYRDLAAWKRCRASLRNLPGVRCSPFEDRRARRMAERQTRRCRSRRLPEPSTISQRVVDGAEGTAAADSPASTASKGAVSADAGSGKDGSKAKAPAPDVYDGAVPVGKWHWPTKGKVIASFGKAGGKGHTDIGRLRTTGGGGRGWKSGLQRYRARRIWAAHRSQAQQELLQCVRTQFQDSSWKRAVS